MSSGNEPEKPTKNWKEYSQLELTCYISRNFDKADCSFFINDSPENKNSNRELRSFKWILSDISPVLNEILSDEKNRAKNFKSIPVSDTNFEGLLSYAHTKSFFDKNFSYMLDLYESSKQYNSEPLRDAITQDFRNKDPNGCWIRYSAIAYRDLSYYRHFFDILDSNKNKTKDWKKLFEYELTSNVETVLFLDLELFLNFLRFTRDNNLNPLICFKATEAYLLKNIFKGKTPNKMEEEDNLIIDHLNNILQYINFDEMSIEDFNNGPAKSALLREESKKYFRSLIRK